MNGNSSHFDISCQQQMSTCGPAHLNDLGKKLLEACRNGDVGNVQKLLTRGAPYVEDWLGNSALHFAAMNGHVETCQYLLSTGIKRDVRTKVDRTPLHLAAQEGHHDVVELMLKSGADRDAIDGLRMTALHWASEHCHVPVIQMLINYGANLQLRDKFERTPLLICASKDHVESCQAICRAMYGDSGTEVVLSHSGETEAINLISRAAAASAFPVRPPGRPDEGSERPDSVSSLVIDCPQEEQRRLRLQAPPASQPQQQQQPPQQMCNSSGGSAADSEAEAVTFGATGGMAGQTLSVPLSQVSAAIDDVGLANGAGLPMEADPPVANVPLNGHHKKLLDVEDDEDEDEEDDDVAAWPVCMEDENEVRRAARNVLEQLDRLHAEFEESEVKVDGLPTDGGVSWLLNFLEMEGLTTEWVNQDEGLLIGRFVSNEREIRCKIRIADHHLIFKVALTKEKLKLNEEMN